jgi:hypothetical protein
VAKPFNPGDRIYSESFQGNPEGVVVAPLTFKGRPKAHRRVSNAGASICVRMDFFDWPQWWSELDLVHVGAE